MINSMTGCGGAQCVDDGISYALEIRTVNNRFLKLSFKLQDHLQFVEPEIEKMLRSRIRRGSVTYSLRSTAQDQSAMLKLNTVAVQQYVDQLSAVKLPSGTAAHIDLSALAMLPGVCEGSDVNELDRGHQLAVVQALTEEALSALVAMRRDEGNALRKDLIASCAAIKSRLGGVVERAPGVMEEYHTRLSTRVSKLMERGSFALEADALAREVAIFAERCDISEELSRLDSHLTQFAEHCDRGEQVGRTLDFLTQELLREANTIASKSSDAQVAQTIVEIKAWIDRLKEQAQNVE
jgi:uncharacterized protein (TIGR00255 family)